MFYVWGKIEVHIEFWWVDLKEKGHLEDIGVDGRTILKWFIGSVMNNNALDCCGSE